MSAQKLLNKPPAFHITLLLATLAPLYIGSYQHRLHHPYGLPTTHQPPLQSVDTATAAASPDFIRNWLSVHVVEPFNPSAIAVYCNQTPVWDPNLVFNLADANGGIGNIRGNFLDFLFYAVEAGASVMLPGMATRSEADLSNVWASRGVFDLMFDEEWFLRAWRRACPQMGVYKPRPGKEMMEPVAGTYFPPSRRRDLDAGNSREGFREHFGSWLKQQDAGKGRGDGEGGMVLVNVGRTLWEVDTRSLSPGFRRNFGQLLRINPAIRRLAAMVVEQLARERQLIIDPRVAIPPQAFYGAHPSPHRRALVDYEVLQRASVFGGFVKSSFSYNIAMTRAQWGEDRGRVVEPWRVLHEEIGVAFDDGFSRVVGRDGWHEARIPRGMWP
ncbi:hypothetical protein KC327_g16579 [Hortaea werneckii]|nr:hypothetical protein KC327_g16579 [Hortaea werneckii]